MFNRIIILFIFLISFKTYGQINLVENGGFEALARCPISIGDTSDLMRFTLGWKRPTLGQSLYFNSCASLSSGLSVPVNWAGVQSAHQGNGYMGFSAYTNPLYTSGIGSNRTYLQTTLKQPLLSGRRYYVQFYINRADTGLLGYAVSNIGAYFSSTPISRNDSLKFDFSPQIETNSLITDKINWIKIAGSFLAKGGEKYLTIGRFGADVPNQILNINGSQAKESFYYIDDLEVIDSCTFLDNGTQNILGPDSQFCVYGSFTKTIVATNNSTASYLWDNGSNFPIRTFTDTGVYWLKMINGNCFTYDSITISSNKNPIVTLGNDTAICFNTSIRMQPKQKKNHYTYHWFIKAPTTNFLVSTNSFYDINSPDKIILEINDLGCKNTDTINVFKSTMKKVSLGNDTAFCRQNELKLDVSHIGASNFLWNTGSTQPLIFTSELETYWLTANDGLCYSSDTIHIQLNGAKKPTLDTTVCESEKLILSADLTSSFINWSTMELTPNIIASANGLYTLTQVNNNCTTLDSIQVVIDKIPYFNLGLDTSVCISPFFLLSAFSPFAKKYKWSTGDSTSFLQVNTSGNYAIEVFNNTCSFGDTISIKVQINTPFTFGPDKYDCFETGIVLSTSISRVDSLKWSTNSSDSFIVVDKPGKYWLRTSYGICTNYDTITFFSLPQPIVNLQNDTSVCGSNGITLDAQNPGCTYLWNNGIQTQSLVVTTPGFYAVTVTNSNGCTDKDSMLFSYFPKPIVFNNNSTLLCSDSSVLIKANPFLVSYLWANGSNLKSVQVAQPGYVSILVQDTFGCKYVDSVLVIEKPKPEIFIQKTLFACELNFDLQTDVPYASYLWQDSITSAEYSVTSYNPIKLTVTDLNKCSNTIFLSIENICPSEVTLPNVFTPNDDGFNDAVIPKYVNIDEVEWKIFNCWGNLVFETNNLNEGWNGRANTAYATDGTYYYTIECIGKNKQLIVQKGTIKLIR